MNLDLSKIRIKSIFKWIKKNNITDNEMMKTFNCGIGFCVIAPKKILKKFKNFLLKNISRMKLDIFQKLERK